MFITFVLLCAAVVYVYAASCTTTSDMGGDSITVFTFATKDDCEDDDNCATRYTFAKGCKVKNKVGNIAGCWKNGIAEITNDCKDNSCDDCKKTEKYGRCDNNGGTYYKVDGCLIGDVGANLMITGAVMIAFGICCCLCCCWICCIPLGCCLMCIGLCVGCC